MRKGSLWGTKFPLALILLLALGLRLINLGNPVIGHHPLCYIWRD